MHFEIDSASLMAGRKFTIFALFYFQLYSTPKLIPSTSPPGDLYSEGQFNGGFLHYDFWGLIFGEDYTWRGLCSEFYGIKCKQAHAFADFPFHLKGLSDRTL